jgi:hypothetical protein
VVDLRGYAWRYRALGMAFPGDSPEALGEELKTVLSYAGRFDAQGALPACLLPVLHVPPALPARWERAGLGFARGCAAG